VKNVELRTRVCRGYAVVVLRGELDTRDAGRRAVSIARSGRAVLSGAVYWTMAWRAAAQGSRAGNRSWSPR
jgi:hypothetical protein